MILLRVVVATILFVFLPALAYDMSRVVRIKEAVWRTAASQHSSRIRELLQPGLTSLSDPRNAGLRRQRTTHGWTALDPENPVYNFLIEYYGLKGAKGPRRLARWSPNLEVLLRNHDRDGILLENASEEDIGDGSLHMRGSLPTDEGIVYSPANFYGKGDPEEKQKAAKAATPFLWYRGILHQTLQNDPILHCHGLHEWAMQYRPAGAPPPPSGKYQAHLPLRVDRQTIAQTVERKGIHCTHVDALRFFSPAAGPLNHHGASLQRTDQWRLEQPACVHAHMDLLKIVLKLQPFCDGALLPRILQAALDARRLDVAASPYNAEAYGVGVVPVETSEGRAQYRREQTALMERVEPIRRDLLRAYDTFLALAFDDEALLAADRRPEAERFATAEPGGRPWRRNLIGR